MSHILDSLHCERTIVVAYHVDSVWWISLYDVSGLAEGYGPGGPPLFDGNRVKHIVDPPHFFEG